MTVPGPDLTAFLTAQLAEDGIPGAVALVARGDAVERAAVGTADVEGTVPMAADAIFRVASVTKPITAAAVMVLVDEGRITLTDTVGRWLPEIAAPRVVRTQSSPPGDTVPAERGVTVEDLLTFRAGWGFPTDFTLPVVQLLMALHRDILAPENSRPADEWMKELAAIPLLAQPGTAWFYNTCADILGVLVERVSGLPFAEFLRDRVFEPLGMADTGFFVPEADFGRFVPAYGRTPEGGLALDPAPARTWATPPAFSSGAGGLVSTADDLLAFGQMLLGGGVYGGRRILSEESVRLMTTNVLTPQEREPVQLFLEGKGWGFGGSVDIEAANPWNVPGRYGWVGGSGTAFHVVPATADGPAKVTVLLTQVAMTGPTSPGVMRGFWEYAAR